MISSIPSILSIFTMFVMDSPGIVLVGSPNNSLALFACTYMPLCQRRKQSISSRVAQIRGTLRKSVRVDSGERRFNGREKALLAATLPPSTYKCSYFALGVKNGTYPVRFTSSVLYNCTCYISILSQYWTSSESHLKLSNKQKQFLLRISHHF